jgi:hypothetical protein
MANRGLPESAEELVESRRILIVLGTGETLSPTSIVHRLHEVNRVRILGLVGHS